MTHDSNWNTQRGMSLVEVLVTVVLISVGLLGVAALQLSSLKGNQESYARSQAAMLAGDILDRMRANQTGFNDGQYTVSTAFDAIGQAGTRGGQDMADWQRAIDQLLPGGAAIAAGSVQRAGNIVTITIRWSEREEDANLRTRVNQTDLPTFVTRSEI